MFGIIQGAMNKQLRRESAEFICSLPFSGIALGGETIGYNMEGTLEVIEWIKDILPADKPIYTMGLGLDPENIVSAFLAGVDMADCVADPPCPQWGTLLW